MEKTKFGVSVALLSALSYFLGYYNLTACVVLFAVILLASDSLQAKKNATQALVLSVIFTMVSAVLGWISSGYMDIVGTVSGWLVEWFDWYNAYDILSKLDFMGWLNGLVGFVELVLMFVFVIMSFKNKNIKIPVVTKIVNKHFGEEEATEENVTEEKTAEEA